MKDEDFKEAERAISAADDFREWICSPEQEADPNCNYLGLSAATFWDESRLPHDRALIRAGIYLIIMLAKDQGDQMALTWWQSFGISALRSFQPGVGPDPIGHLHHDVPSKDDPDFHKKMMAIARETVAGGDKTQAFKERAQREKEADDQAISEILAGRVPSPKPPAKASPASASTEGSGCLLWLCILALSLTATACAVAAHR